MIYATELWEILAKTEVVVFDCLGVLFEDRVIYDQEKGEVGRFRSLEDGQGISLLRSTGVHLVFMTAAGKDFIEPLVNRFNNLPSTLNGTWKKVTLFHGVIGKEKTEALGKFLENEKIASWNNVAYMGNDVGDYDVMQKVGFTATPQNGQEVIKKISNVKTEKKAGDGAVRDFCNLILKAKGADATKLPFK